MQSAKCKPKTQTPIELWVASKIIFLGPLSLQRFRHRFCSHAGQHFIQLLEKELFGWKMQPASQTTDLNALLPKTNIYLALHCTVTGQSKLDKREWRLLHSLRRAVQGDLFDYQLQFLHPDPQLSPFRCSDQLDLCGSLGSPHHLHFSPRRQRGPTWLWLRALEVKKSKINIPFSFIYGFIVIEVVRNFSIFYLTFIGLQIFQLMHSQKLYFYNWENWVTPLSYDVVSANTASWKPGCYKKSVTGCT